MKILKKYISLILLFISSVDINAQQWMDVGGGADNVVEGTYVDTISNLLYVGGRFDHLGGDAINQVGIWNGSNWSTVGTNAHFTYNSFSGQILALTLFNGELIAAGRFDSVAGIPAGNIARWDGIQWNAMSDGFDDLVTCLEVYNGELYAGGYFHHSGTDTIYNISKWNGTNWMRLGIGWGLDNVVISMTVFNQRLIIGGSFNGAYQTSVWETGVIVWNGINWDTIGAGFNNGVASVKIIQDTLYAVGKFTSIPLNHSYYISKWDGTAWQPVPYPSGGPQPQIHDVAFYQGNLYVCGLFTIPPDIAKFNGSGYDSVGNVTGYVDKMIVYNNELYVSGNFSSINGTSVSNIARYSLVNSMEEISLDNRLLIYPNPASITEKLRLQFNYIALEYHLNMFDMMGRSIYQFSLRDKESSLELPDKLKPGIYFITISDKEKNTHSVKLILN